MGMQALATLLTLLLAAQPVGASVRMVTLKPARVRAPVQALNNNLRSSLHVLSLPAITPGLSELSLNSIQDPAIPQIPQALLPQVEQAIAVQQRLTEARLAIDPKEDKQLFQQATKQTQAPKDRRQALEVLSDVAAVFKDFSIEDIENMPADELSTLAGAVLEQRRNASDTTVLPGFHAASILSRRHASQLLAARGKPRDGHLLERTGVDSLNSERTTEVPKHLAPSEMRVLRHYTDQDGWRRIVETSTLKNGHMPYVHFGNALKRYFTRLTGAFLTSAQHPPKHVGVDAGLGYYVDLLLPKGMPLLEIEKDRILFVPLPSSTRSWVKTAYNQWLNGERQTTPQRKTAEGVAEAGGPGPDIHIPIRVLQAGRLNEKTTPLPLDILHHQGNHLFHGDTQLEFVGAGEWGRVYVHPHENNAVVKLSVKSAAAALSTLVSDAEAFDADHRMSLRLAEADAGPRVLASGKITGKPTWLHRKAWGLFGKTATVDDRYALAKERIFGSSVEDLIRTRRFDDAEYLLVEQLLDRLAAGGLKPGDLRLSNIMIGTTGDNATPRAYVIDGGGFHPIAKDTTTADLRTQLDEMLVHSHFAPGVDRQPPEQILEPLGLLLRKGVRRSAAKTVAQRLKAAIVYEPPVR
jgi:hypothetical protein